MLAEPVCELDRAVLGSLCRVGDGGQGIVYFTDKILINKVWRAVYKEYLPGTTFDPDVLRQMIAFVFELDGDNGRWLCETMSWPAALVLTGGRVTGFLMRRIPDRFWKPWGKNGAYVPAALHYLLSPQVYLDRKGICLDAGTRLRLLETIADVVARLHSLGVVVGDLVRTSPRWLPSPTTWACWPGVASTRTPPHARQWATGWASSGGFRRPGTTAQSLTTFDIGSVITFADGRVSCRHRGRSD